jgi:hypothetical protein
MFLGNLCRAVLSPAITERPILFAGVVELRSPCQGASMAATAKPREVRSLTSVRG